MENFDWVSFYEEVFSFYRSAFTKEMLQKRIETESRASMGGLDAAALYVLVKTYRPRVVVETGSYRGMSTAFILKGMQDAGVVDGKVYSIDNKPDASLGALIPEELKSGFVSLIGDVKTFVVNDELPGEIDMFLHDSSHRYQYQRWEFEVFWPRIKAGGCLVSHDVNMNASFVDFVSRTYVHNEAGKAEPGASEHVAWGRLDRLGFVVKS